jgi:hypothetical protein
MPVLLERRLVRLVNETPDPTSPPEVPPKAPDDEGLPPDDREDDEKVGPEEPLVRGSSWSWRGIPLGRVGARRPARASRRAEARL